MFSFVTCYWWCSSHVKHWPAVLSALYKIPPSFQYILPAQSLTGGKYDRNAFYRKKYKKKKKRGWQIVGHLRTRSPKPCSSDNSEGRCVGSDQKEMCVGMFVHESTRSNDSLRWQWERRSFKRAGFPEQGSTQQGSWWHLHSLWDQQP